MSGFRPTNTGIPNLGNTCYINTAIQCLSHVPIMKVSVIDNQQSNGLASTLRNLFKNMESKHALTAFQSSLPSEYRQGTQQNLGGFLEYLIYNVQTLKDNTTCEMKCKEVCLKNNTHMRVDTSVTNYMRFVIRSQNFKVSELFSSVKHKNCRECGCESRISHSRTFTTSPAVLILDVKYSTGVTFDGEYDLSDRMIKLNDGCEYRLMSVAYHVDFGNNNGHFYAICRVGGKWVKFNDNTTETVDILPKKNSYILFYQRC